MVSEIVTELIAGFSKELGGLFGAALGGLAVYLYQKGKAWWKEKQKKKKNSIPGLVGVDIAVYKHLTELRTRTDADRAFVVQFHNGTYYLNQANQMKMSCTHEIVKDGVSREEASMKDILLSKVPLCMQELLSDPYVVFHVDELDNRFLFQVFRIQGVKKCVAALIREKDTVEGFVAISYLEDEPVDGLDEEQLGELVISTANRIGYILRINHI